MAGIKSLAKDTAVYGLSSIIGRFLNWCLVPLYTQMFPPGEYGEVIYIYTLVALALIVLTYGMETGFFRFANHEKYKDPMEVYSTALISLSVTSITFIALVAIFLSPISLTFHCANHESYIMMMAIAVALDAFTALPFSYLRYAKRPMRFAGLRLINIGANIALNLFFILICPWLWKQAPGWIAWFYDPDFGIGYIFLANLITSALNLLLLLPELKGFKWKFNPALWREMIGYSAPLLVLGLAGIMNQNIYSILMPLLYPDKANAMTQVGIYGANYKIGIVMEVFYLDILRHFIASTYFSGLKVVPIVMIAELFFGISFNLSLWYKLTDRTAWGMWLSLFGLAMTIGLNVLLVPHYGYMGCAWAAFGCYGSMMAASYILGRIYYPINYNLPKLSFYFISAIALWFFSEIIAIEAKPWINMLVRTPLLLAYIYMALRMEKVQLSFRKR